MFRGKSSVDLIDKNFSVGSVIVDLADQVDYLVVSTPTPVTN